jgi:hypothetical protein
MSWTEASFKTELVAAFERAGHTCHKFPDLARGVKKPYDLVCGIGGLYVGVETKLVKVGTAASAGRWHEGLIVLRHEDVRTNQHKALRETAATGNVALVVGGIYDRHDYHREAYALPYEQFLTRAVWTRRDCVREAIWLSWERGQGWDVEALAQWVTVKRT